MLKLVTLGSYLLMMVINGAAGLRCYACMPDRQIAGAQLGALSAQLRKFPRCSDMNVKDPGLQYELHCPRGLDKTCVKIRDEQGNEMRSCFGSTEAKCSKQTKKGQSLCTCKGDFCNSASGIVPSLMALFLAAATVVIGLH